MKRLISHAASLFVAILMTACAASESSRQRVAVGDLPQKKPFEVALSEHLARLAPTQQPVKPSGATSSAVADFDAAVAREQEIMKLLRDEYGKSGTLPAELLEELKSEIPESKLDAIYRELIDVPTAPMPEHMLALIGGKR
ncbi:MAG: hypothetical protein AB7I19_13915 [Planctomycetota bacterium]